MPLSQESDCDPVSFSAAESEGPLVCRAVDAQKRRAMTHADRGQEDFGRH